jgi:hypothetical protein
MIGHLKLGGTNPRGDSISVNSEYLEMNGRPFIPVMGEMHYSRLPHSFWEEEILKVKAAGIGIISTYVMWIHHEEEEGLFDWSGDRNLRLFAELIRKHGLYFLPRIGPFVHGECRNGGLPDWLYGRPFEVRSNDYRYLHYVDRLYKEIGEQLSGLLFKDGGPVIGVQLENEFMGASAPWDVALHPGSESVPVGSGGEEHMMILKRLAVEAGIQVPLYTCTGWNRSPVPQDEMLPMQGDYPFQPWEQDPDYQQSPSWMFVFRRLKSKPCWYPPQYDPERYPMSYCEIGCGVQITCQHRPVVPPDSVAAAPIVKLAGGANFLGFYMFRGGTNPIGKHGYMNEYAIPRLSYDFQAPIGEYGQIRESYKRLKLINMFVKDFGDYLAPMSVVVPEGSDQMPHDDTETLRFAARVQDDAGFLFLNNYQDHVDMPDRKDVQVVLRLEDEIIRIPMQRGITLRSGVSTMLPFNFRMAGILLKYSTTQLICRLVTENGEHFFFCTPDGISPEYVFDRGSVRDIDAGVSEVFEKDDTILVSVKPEVGCVIRLVDRHDKPVHIVTLSWTDALRFWKGRIWGRERVFLYEGSLMFRDEDIEILSRHQTADLYVFPEVDTGLASLAAMSTDQEGIFTRYSVEMAPREVVLDIERLSACKAFIRFPQDLLEGVNDIFLRIEYIGDTAAAYIDGRLVADSFWNGSVWEIGLKRFAPAISGGEMVLLVSPVTKQTPAAKYLSQEMMARLDSAETGLCEICSITAVAEYRVMVGRGIASV